MYSKFFHRFTSLMLALVIIFAGYSPALAAPPSNDNFADAEVISLPFSATVDITNATNEQPNEPQNCYSMDNSLWYSFTPAESMVVAVNSADGAIFTNVNIYRAGSGISDLQFLSCTGAGAFTTFSAEANQTYYLQAGSEFGEVGYIRIDLEQIPPPANDNFGSAKPIDTDALPFSDSVDNILATTENDEPHPYTSVSQTIWYLFTPSTSAVLIADMTGSSFSDTILNIYQSTAPGFGGLNFLGYATYGESITFSVQAGMEYYIQAGSINNGGGNLHLNLQEIPPPPNDNFASTSVVSSSSLPFDDSVNTIAATFEANEPYPSSCGQNTGDRTVWYAFTPAESSSFSASIVSSSFYPILAVYTGNSLGSLTMEGCNVGWSVLTFQGNAGTTYYIQAAGYYGGTGGQIQFHLQVTPLPVAGIYYYPPNPSVFDTIQFYDQSYDPGQASFQSFTWDFGDGTTSTDPYPIHKYESDGDYTVQHSVTTTDGRTASTSQVVQVRTHDVTITKVETPESSKVGKNVKINVSVNNPTAYSEMVRIELYRSIPGGGFELVDAITQEVPAFQKGDKTTEYSFHYTFTSGDAAVGKVIFRAVATIENASDAFPQDNERLSSLTIVKKK